jgi:hypothetical protein
MDPPAAAEAEIVGFTITETAEEFTDTPTSSLTWRMKLQMPAAVVSEVAKPKLVEFEPAGA